MGPHVCSEHCVCPDHGTPLLWSASHEIHACQDPTCRYAHGLEPMRLKEFLVRYVQDSFYESSTTLKGI